MCTSVDIYINSNNRKIIFNAFEPVRFNFHSSLYLRIIRYVCLATPIEIMKCIFYKKKYVSLDDKPVEWSLQGITKTDTCNNEIFR